MKPRSLAGIVLGVVALAYQGFTYTKGPGFATDPIFPPRSASLAAFLCPRGSHLPRSPPAGQWASVVLFHTSTQ